MGVLGLWKLVDATGKQVPLETLEGKVLAIDISIWIHQVIQGYQDRRGSALPNAHLIGLFNRICKLMYFKIKPVFVFDGGVPLLKKNTIATRRKLKSIAASKAQKLKNDLINNLIKHTAVKGALEKKNDEGESSAVQQFKDAKAVTDPSVISDMFKLPDMPSTSKIIDPDDYIDSEDEDELKLSPRKQKKWAGNIHSVDVNNEEFKSLPADVRYDILTDLKETRKQSSWGRMHELPTGSNKYSGFQVNRLLKRRYVQESLEIAEKEMGGKTLTLEELDRLLTDQGINTTKQQDAAFRIASDSTTRVIYLKDSQATQISNDSDANSKEATQKSIDSDSNSKESKSKEKDSTSNDAFSDSMSVNSDNSVLMVDDMKAYDFDDVWESDEGFETTIMDQSIDSPLLAKSSIPKSVMNPALAYMLENSGLTREQIEKIVKQRKKNMLNSDGGSSHESSRKSERTPRRLSAQKKKRKLSFEVECSDVRAPKIKKEVLDGSKVLNIDESNSDSEDFVEVSENNEGTKEQVKNDDLDRTITKESTDEESDDFVEVEDVPIPELISSKKPRNDKLEIMIKADEKLDDDIFADVFTDTHSEKTIDLDKTKTTEIVTSEKEELTKIEKEQLVKDDVIKDSKVLLSTIAEVAEEEFETKTDSEDSFDNTEIIPPNNNKNNTSLHDENLVEKITDEEVISNTIAENTSNEIEDSITNENSITENSNALTKIDSQEESPNNAIKDNNEVEVVEVEKEPAIVLPVDEKELESMKQQLESEQQAITGTLGKLERQAIDITDQMRIEAQELLRLFGIPYLVAPMEAEAQCAYLEQINLVDGTITDDSDIWLFGGRCVYKNFFDNNKKVLQFLSNDIEHHFKLSRKEMIQLALLVGSDYTNGLAGVGPVTALEILASFPSEGEDLLRGLRAFATWFKAGKLAAPGKISLRNKLKNVQIEKGFPSQAVVQAYLAPLVDESREAFSWGKPNMVLLADYAKRKFGWTRLKFDEIINPVMKRFNETQSQKGIASYFKVKHVPKSIETILSKRVQTAVQKLSGKGNEDENTEEQESTASTSQEKVKKPRKTTGKRGKDKNESSEVPVAVKTSDDEENKTEDTADIQTTESQIETELKLEPVEVGTTKKQPRKIILPESTEVIPQRERNKVNALQTKLKAIEIYRKSKKGLNRVQKRQKVVKKIKKNADLSESSSDE